MSETATQIERLVNTTKAGEILDLNRRDVTQLIRDGKLAAKKQIVRGKGGKPRYKILLSELNRYMLEMPDAVPSAQRPAKEDRQPRRGELDVIQFV